MIEFHKEPGQRILELGGGENRNPAADCCVDIRPLPGKVDFTCDLEQFPWPLQDSEWDCVLAVYLLEHLSYLVTKKALAEVLRILKPGGRFILVVPNTANQLKWIQDHQEGWDGKDAFTAASELLFGSQSYNLNDAQPEFSAANVHKSYWSPATATPLLREAGFDRVTVAPYGERQTDMVIDAGKALAPAAVDLSQDIAQRQQEVAAKLGGAVMPAQPKETAVPQQLTRAEMFDKAYFNGGGKVGGYAKEGYSDFACHEITTRHILARQPKSVLEIGAARGYILKRLTDRGIPGVGLEISRHCYLTRVCDPIHMLDICAQPWPVTAKQCDLNYSLATLEHIPEEFLPHVISEMARCSERGLHGIDFGERDDNFDKTHCTLRDKAWWEQRFAKYAPGYPVEIVDKEALEQGDFPPEVLKGDGKVKLNIGSFIAMTRYGWTNIDICDLGAYAQQQGFQFVRADLTQGLPFLPTGSVDLVFSSHCLEHLTYKQGQSLLRELRRVIKPTGVMRLLMPDAQRLIQMYQSGDLSYFDECNDECAASPTQAGKLWSLLHAGHQAAYDAPTLSKALSDAGFTPVEAQFRQTSLGAAGKQILSETTEFFADLSLIAEATPTVA